MRPHLSKVWHWGQQHQPQRNRGQDVPPSANSNAPQYSRHGTARGLLEGSEERATLHRPGQATSWNSTKGTPERRVESPAPVKDERSIEELSESRVREDEQRGASRYHAIETDAIREQHRTEVAILTENHRQSMVEQRFKLQVAEERNAQLLQALKSKSNDLNSAQAAWEKSKMDVSDIWQSLTEKERQLKIIEQTQADERLRHADAVAALNQEIRNTEANYKDQVASLNWRQMQEIEKLQDGHAAKISRLVQEHEDEIYRYQQDIESVKTNAEKHRRNLGVTHDEQLAQLMGQHEITVAQKEAELAQLAREEEKKRQNLTASHGEQRAQILKEHDQALSRINDELAEVRQDKEWKISQLKEAHAAELSQRDVSHAQGTRQLREDVQRLNAALLTRDDQLYQGELFTTPDLPTRPDEQIRAKFSEIEQMVDSIGRLQWRQEPAVWTSEVLRSVGGNITDRVLKKAIVQDLVWCLLSTHIFCSPFRVFGAEGRVLEEEWNEQCGQGIYIYTPPPYISFFVPCGTDVDLIYRWRLERGRGLLMAGARRQDRTLALHDRQGVSTSIAATGSVGVGPTNAAPQGIHGQL